MQYRVLWSPYAEERLEQLLQESFGESRYDKMRIGFLNPLGVDFEVMDDLRTVVVHDVWRITRRN
jgi:hypothetical protein